MPKWPHEVKWKITKHSFSIDSNGLTNYDYVINSDRGNELDWEDHLKTKAWWNPALKLAFNDWLEGTQKR